VRTLIKRDFEAVFADGIDAILTPATPSAAFALGEVGERTRCRCISTMSSRFR
jgi:aspartyl-tRNA(Asn)/glutamyl-tRNA(Gln) amidotransferase subunit A